MAFVNDSQYSGQSAIQDVRLIRSNLDRVVRLPFGCMDVATVGNTIYGFASDGHLVIMSTLDSAAQSYQMNLQIDTVYGVTQDGVAILGMGESIYMVDLA